MACLIPFRYLAAVILVSSLFHANLASAQTDPASMLRVRKIDGRQLNAPGLRINNPGGGTNEEWFRITTEYETSPDWVDELSITYYILFKPNQRTAGILNPASAFLLLRGESEYVNVAKGRHVSEVYVHPNTIERYGQPQRIGVVYKAQGRLLATHSEPDGKTSWWERLAPMDGLILERALTPFNPTSPDHYEAMKAKGTGGR